MSIEKERDALAAELAAIRAAGGEVPAVRAFLMLPDLFEPYVDLRRDGSCGHCEPLMTVAQHQRIVAAMAAELEHANQWRDLALQFDRHRMSAMALLKAVSAGNAAAADVDAFLAAPPPPPLAGQVSVPRELLRRVCWPVVSGSDRHTHSEVVAELRALLATPSMEVRHD